MEGLFFLRQATLPLRKATLPLIAAGLLIPQTLFGQAMGQVTLDANSGSLPLLQSQITVAMPPAPPTTTLASAESTASAIPEAKTAPLPATTLPATSETKTPTSTPPLNEKPAVEALPVAPTAIAPVTPAIPATTTAAPVTTPATPLRPIEQQEIRPRSQAATELTAPAAPAKSTPPSTLSHVFQVVAALAVVIGLIFLGKALAKKYIPAAKTAGNGKGVIEVLARYPLCKNQSLVLVRIGSQIVTLNQGRDQSQSILVISDQTEVAKILGQIDGTSPRSIQSGFNKLLSNARMDLSDPANDPARELANEIAQNDFESRSMEPENLDTQLEEMAAAKRQLMELRQQVRSVRDSLPR
jgi:flagellar biogenesis protein FliO